MNEKNFNPYRAGVCDALFFRECNSPWKDDGWKATKKNSSYLKGYLHGEYLRVKNGIKEAI